MGDLVLIPELGKSLEEGMVTHSSILAWRIHGQRILAGYGPWGRKGLGMTKHSTGISFNCLSAIFLVFPVCFPFSTTFAACRRFWCVIFSFICFQIIFVCFLLWFLRWTNNCSVLCCLVLDVCDISSCFFGNWFLI